MTPPFRQTLLSVTIRQLRLLLVIPILLFFLTIIAFATYLYTQMFIVQQKNLSHSVAYTVDAFLDNASRTIEALASSSIIESREKMIHDLSSFANAYKSFDAFYMLDSNGKIITLVPDDPRYVGLDMSGQSYFQQALLSKTPVISRPFISLRTGQPTVYISQAYQNGVIVGELSLSLLKNVAISGTNVPGQTTIFITDNMGTLLTHPDHKKVQEQVNYRNLDIIKKGQTQDGSMIYQTGNEFFLAATVRTQQNGWIVVVQTPLILIYGPFWGTGTLILTICILILILVIRSFLHRFKKMVFNPIYKLNEITGQIAAGNYTISQKLAEIPTDYEEISTLSENFGIMSLSVLERENLLKHSEEQYRWLVEYSPDAMIVHDGRAILYINPAAVKLYGVGNSEELLNKPISEMIAPQSRQAAAEHFQSFVQHLAEHPQGIEQQVHIKVDGSTFYAEVTTSPVIYKENQAALTIIRDITARKNIELSFQHLATHDPLTGIANRLYFLEKLSQAIDNARINSRPAAVFFLDLDNFKAVNDAFGHKSGDQILKTIASALDHTVQDRTLLARLGGDEFALILEDLDTPKEAASLAERILKIFHRPHYIHGKEVYISASIGISMYPNDAEDPQSLLQNADTAMFHAKSQGKNNYQFFSLEMKTQAQERIELSTKLHYAMELEELYLAYQPQVAISTEQVTGIEALLRWNNSQMGAVPPSKFISLAEETGLITPIGEWVLRSACLQNIAWQKAGMPPVRVSVNISEQQIKHHKLVTLIDQILTDTGLPPQYLELELTENIIFQNLKDSQLLVNDLKKLGVSLAMDDFGAGYSTLSQLADIHFDVLKIDQSFARKVTIDSRKAGIVTGIISIAKDLGMQVIAEGVENREQFEFFRSHACDSIQGWYYCHAVTPLEIETILRYGLPTKKQVV
jgi:diguanylate cyclase (GGDEF)-like protein/PAS domain S-box-containing protein